MTKARRSTASLSALMAILAPACHRGLESTEIDVTTQPLTTVDIDRVLGFEAATVSDWSIINNGPGTLNVSTTPSEGARSLAVTTRTYVSVQSVALPSLGSRVGSAIHFDIMPPPELKQVSPSWYGATQLYVSIPSLGLYNYYLGQAEITPLTLGQWNTVTFTPTSDVLTKLRASYTDLRITIAVNAPSSATKPYLLDNLRFSDKTLALVTVTDGAGHPLSGLTVAAYTGSTVTSNTGVTDSTGLAKVWVPQGSFRFGVTEAGVTTYSSPTNQCQVPGVCAAATIIVKCHNVVCAASDACHNPGVCQPSTGACSPPTSTGIRSEAENSSPAVSSSDRQDVVADTAASNGKLDVATLNAVGDYVRYTVHLQAPGDYAVTVRTRQGNNQGKFQVVLDGATNLGPVVNGYAAKTGYALTSLGTVHVPGPTACQDHTFSFKVTGKDAASTGYGISVDYIDLGPPQQLSGHISPAMASAPLVGTLPPDTEVAVTVSLPVQDFAGLKALAQQVSDPTSPNYRQFLTPDQFRAAFGVPETQYQALCDWAVARGLGIVQKFSNRLVLTISGSAADVQSALHIQLNQYLRPDGTIFYGPDSEPSLDLDLATVQVLFVNNLNNYHVPQPATIGGSGANDTDYGRMTPSNPYGMFHQYTADNIRSIYAKGTPLRGDGQCVGILTVDGFSIPDVETYEGDLQPKPTITVVNADHPTVTLGPSSRTYEPWMDVELAIAMAPGLSSVYVVESGADDGHGTAAATNDYAMLAMMADKAGPLCKQISCSFEFGYDDSNAQGKQNYEQAFSNFMVQGQSFFQATGDYGAESPSWVWAASRMDYMTAVGGSVVNLDESLSPGSQVSESAWRWSEGGIYTPSLGYSVGRPKYQEFVANTQNLASDQYRNIPDVAAMAQDVQVVGTRGGFSGSGASAATPIWAGFLALVNQRNAIVGLGPVGFINPAIYAIGKSPALYGAGFNDIVDCFDPNGGSVALNAACNPTTTETWKEVCSMTNPADCMPGYPVVPGYDLVTGWGSPRRHLIDQLSATKPIGVGLRHACALRSDGTDASKGDLYCWGLDADGELGDGVTPLPQSNLAKATPVKVGLPSGHLRVVEVAPGFPFTCALLEDRNVYCWGQVSEDVPPSSVPSQMSSLSDVVSIVSGSGHACALDGQGVLSCWGMNDSGQLGRGSAGTSPGLVDATWPVGTFAVSAAIGFAHTCALISDGTVYCWGWNFAGQLGNATNLGVYEPDSPNLVPTKVEFAWPSKPVALAAGYNHTCASLADGTVYCWGSYDVLGLDYSIVPLQILTASGPLTKVVEIASAKGSPCALLEGGSASCWGRVDSSTFSSVALPVSDAGGGSTLTGIVAMTGTGWGDTTCLLVKDKRVVCWGTDLQGSFVGGVAQDSVPFASPKAVQF